jgi:hypothetical protein
MARGTASKGRASVRIEMLASMVRKRALKSMLNKSKVARGIDDVPRCYILMVETDAGTSG